MLFALLQCVFGFFFFIVFFLQIGNNKILSLKLIFIKNKKQKQTTKPSKKENKNSQRLLIILARFVLFLALFLIIIHKLCTYRCISKPIGVHHVANDVYEDIAAANVQMVLQCLRYKNNCNKFLESLRDWSRSYLYI